MSLLRTTTALALTTFWMLLTCSHAQAAPTFVPGVQTGTIQYSSTQEASGIAVSRSNANVLWTHNDSGDSARVFAMTPAGTHLGAYSINGASAADWEDIAVGPGPADSSQYLYIGDIGDNLAIRPTISVYRVAEPFVSDTQSPVTTSLSGASKLTFAYPDGPRDAESMFVDPLTRDIYILTKRENPHRLYRAAYPQATSGTTTLEFVTSYATTNWLTAADISPDGDEILVRGTNTASGRLFVRPPGGTIADALDSAPITIPLRSEPQGEAIGFDSAGWGYYTISEGTNQPIYFFNRLPEPGDFNHDGAIDAADYVALRKTEEMPDAYNTWRENFGEPSAATPAALSTPEPSSVCTIIAALITIVFRRLRHASTHKSHEGRVR
jgi:hypothetical protein